MDERNLQTPPSEATRWQRVGRGDRSHVLDIAGGPALGAPRSIRTSPARDVGWSPDGQRLISVVRYPLREHAALVLVHSSRRGPNRTLAGASSPANLHGSEEHHDPRTTEAPCLPHST